MSPPVEHGADPIYSGARYQHHLAGCRPEPLGSYLVALGVLRLVAEQADRAATGHWDAEGFVLGTDLDEADLEAFFLDRYQPTPVLSPWNNSSGFGPEGRDQLGAIESSEDPRLAGYREAIAEARRLRALPWWVDVAGSTKDPLKERKVLACRSWLPDTCLAWIDTAVVLTAERAVYPPILGTGGNDGRLEFSRNFHEQVLEALGLGRRPAQRQGWLRDALDGTATMPLVANKTPGQFDPGAAGGPNSAPDGAAAGLLNPWGWVLLIEGSVLFASGVSRRMSSRAAGKAAAPFTVASTPAGYASAADAEGSRGELWLPLWSRPTGLGELRHLFAESRADWGGRHVRTGLEMAKAAASLGVDRGLVGFSRHALLERNGLATAATSIGRLATADRPRPELAPLAELDRDLDAIRRVKNAPATVKGAMAAMERAQFDVVTGAGPLVSVLVAAAGLYGAVARSASMRDQVKPARLDGDAWARALLDSDGSPELRVALSFASTGDEPEGKGRPGGLQRLVVSHWDQHGFYPAPVPGLGFRPVVEVLATAHARRVVELVKTKRTAAAGRRQPSEAIGRGVATRFARGTPPPLGDLAALARGALDLGRLSELLGACLLLGFERRISWVSSPPDGLVPPALATLAPFYAAQPGTQAILGTTWSSRLAATPLVPEQSWPAQLAAGALAPVLAAATRRLRIAGLDPLVGSPLRPGASDVETAQLVGAALLCPISRSMGGRALESRCPDPDPDRAIGRSSSAALAGESPGSDFDDSDLDDDDFDNQQGDGRGQP